MQAREGEAGSVDLRARLAQVRLGVGQRLQVFRPRMLHLVGLAMAVTRLETFLEFGLMGCAVGLAHGVERSEVSQAEEKGKGRGAGKPGGSVDPLASWPEGKKAAAARGRPGAASLTCANTDLAPITSLRPMGLRNNLSGAGCPANRPTNQRFNLASCYRFPPFAFPQGAGLVGHGHRPAHPWGSIEPGAFLVPPGRPRGGLCADGGTIRDGLRGAPRPEGHRNLRRDASAGRPVGRGRAPGPVFPGRRCG